MLLEILPILAGNLLTLITYTYSTRRRVTYFYFILLYFLTHNIIRPISISYFERSYLYPSLDISKYPKYLLISSMLFQILIFGYMAFSSRKKISKKVNPNYNRFLIFDWFNITICGFVMFLMFKNFGVLFLAFNRIKGISAQFPESRYLYPFALLSSALLVGRGISLLLQHKNLRIGSFFILFGSIVTTIINQRGLAITFSIVAGISIAQNKIRVDRNIIFLALSIFFMAFILRGLPQYLLNKDSVTKQREESSYLEKIGKSADGDSVEVWIIIEEFIERNGFQYGKTILNNVYNIFQDNRTRISKGHPNGLDLINEYWSGNSYTELKFGFNISTFQELYLNFSFFSVLFMILFSYFLARETNRYHSKIEYSEPVYESLRLVAVYNILSSFAGFQWTILMMIYYFLYKITYK
jgi:hypothetical protein